MSELAPTSQFGMDEILRAIPHRAPLLLIDRVEGLVPFDSIVATRLLRADEPWFAGHFPGHPVFPGVLIVEALAQAGAVLAAHSNAGGMADHVPYLVNIENARVRKPVYPGQQLELRVKRVRAWGSFWRLQGEAFVNGDLVASATLMAALMPRDALPAAPLLEHTGATHRTTPCTDDAHVGA